MRQHARKAVPLALAAVISTGLVATVLAGSTTANAADTQVVEYLGYQITVPADWDVVDLAKAPDTCVRFDKPTVYLGHPNPEATCPADLAGRTDSLLIQPADQSTADQVGTSQVQTLEADGSLPPTYVPTPDHEILAAVEPAGIVVEASYGETSANVEQILRTGVVTAAAKPAALPAPSAASDAAASAQTYGTQDLATYTVAPGAFWGYAFDTCTTPSFGQMDAWMAGSPYRAAGIYIGGGMRACAQPNLTPEWIARQAGQGWRMLPLYVGHQAPCSQFAIKIRPDEAWDQGVVAAVDATIQASYLGIQPGSVIYFNMESYDNTDAACSSAVLTYLSAWTSRLHYLGYRSGVYSSAATGIADQVRAVGDPSYQVPDHIWFARWDGSEGTTDPVIPNDYWAFGQRLKQFKGGHDETFAGVLMNGDSDFADLR